jgi:signal transduction histidine kinase
VFSRDRAIHPLEESLPDPSVFIKISFEDFLQEFNLCAGFLCLWIEESIDVVPITAIGIPIAPFKGSRKDSLKKYVRECLRLHPAPHIHSIKNYKLWTDISSLISVEDWQPRTIFLPVFIGDFEFVLICFTKDKKIKDISEDMIRNVSEVIQIAEFILSAHGLKDKIKVMEIYVREIGHDIASSVQAIISKLRNLSRGLIVGPAAITKIREAEEEIMATYRIADTLGITVDPDYNIGIGDNFEAESLVQEVVNLCLSEAAERHIEILVEKPGKIIPLWGDTKAIQSALMQLLMNAIKYSRGSSFVTLRINEFRETVEFTIMDKGIPLDFADEQHIWNFGWRGSKAKEMHVNGSGIGLFSVKKIVKAHGGTANVRVAGENRDIITFSFRIPKPYLLEKYPIKVQTG